MSAFDINAQTNVLRHKREIREFYKRHSLLQADGFVKTLKLNWKLDNILFTHHFAAYNGTT